MWIIPKSIILAFAPATEVLILDSVTVSQTCEQLLTVRSRRVQSKHFLQEWKKKNLMRLRSGAISSPSLGNSFLEWWTSSLADTPANHSQQQENEKGNMIQDICGHGSQMELGLCDPKSAFSRMSKDTSRWDFPQSSAIWKNWVTRCRGEYLARKSVIYHTSEQEYLYLPTPCANEDSYRLNGNSQQSKCLEAKARRGEIGKPGKLNPQFVEMMMDLPIGWTDCACSATE